MKDQTFGISCDWGTSTLRAYLLGKNDQILEKRVHPSGIMMVKDKAFESAFESVVGDWMDKLPRLPIILSGMIGSRQGWKETPYIECPTDVGKLYQNLVAIKLKRGRKVWITPGLSCLSTAGIPDVMRGEEVQILGANTTIKANKSIICLPGSHSKWAIVSSGKVLEFVTYMTGELYETVTKNTILRTTINSETWNSTAFLDGVDHARAPNNLLNHLFNVRSLNLFNKLSPNNSGAFLSGLIIGHELNDATVHSGNTTIHLIGEGKLTNLYSIALNHLGFETKTVPPEIVTAGHMQLLKMLMGATSG